MVPAGPWLFRGTRPLFPGGHFAQSARTRLKANIDKRIRATGIIRAYEDDYEMHVLNVLRIDPTTGEAVEFDQSDFVDAYLGHASP